MSNHHHYKQYEKHQQTSVIDTSSNYSSNYFSSNATHNDVLINGSTKSLFNKSIVDQSFSKNNLKMENQMDTNGGSHRKKRHKKEKKKKNKESHSNLNLVSIGTGETVQSSTMYSYGHQQHSYPIHHVVEETESFIIKTRKLSVLESVQCPGMPSHLATTIPGSGNSASIANMLTNATSSTSSTQFNLQIRPIKIGEKQNKKKKKDKKHKHCNSSHKIRANKQLSKCGYLDKQKTCDYSSCSGSYSSTSSSSDSHSDDDSKLNHKTNAKHEKAQKRKKSSIHSSSRSSSRDSSTSSSKSSSSSSSSSSTSSSNSSSSSSTSTSSSNSSSTSSSEGDSKSSCSSCISRSSSSCSQSSKAEDVLTNISLKESDEKMLKQITMNCKKNDQQTTQTMIQTSNTSQHSSVFSVDTILQEQQTSTSLFTSSTHTTNSSESNYQIITTASTESKATSNIAVLNQTASECNSNELPNESNQNKEATTAVKKRDPAEERQRLRNYRIPHHRSLIMSKSSSLAVSCSISTLTTSTVSSSIATTNSTISTTNTIINNSQTKSSQSTLTSTTTTNKTKTILSSSTSTIEAAKKERTTNKSSNKDAQNSPSKKLTIANANSNRLAATQQPVPVSTSNPFLNSSFLVPGTSTLPGFPSNFPFHSAFMPTVFNNQLLNSVQLSTKTKTTVSNQLTTNRQFYPSQSQQSQLTIFTSPPLASNSVATNTAALSPFSFPGAMSHSTLLSPQFSTTGGTAAASTTAPLIMPKSLNFQPNLSFPANDPALMMFSLGKSSNSISQTAPNITTTTTSPFILPRIVPTNTTSNVNNVPSSALPKTLNKSKNDRSTTSNTKQLSPATIDARSNFGTSTIILPNTASPNANQMNTQHSPLSTIISPQTLLLLQSPLSPFGKENLQISNTTASATTVGTSKSLVSIKPNQTPIKTMAPSIVHTTSQPSSIKPATLANNANVILAPTNSTIPHLPYTLFSQQSAMMQPISIQAPPPPPSSMFGTPLLLSVISPTNRNQQNSSPVIINKNLEPIKSKDKFSKNKPETTSLKSIQPKVEKQSKSCPIITTTSPTITTQNLSSKQRNKQQQQQSNNKSSSNKELSNVDDKLKSPLTITTCNIPSNELKISTTPETTVTTTITSTSQSNEIKHTESMLKSPQSDEFESLVQSVKNTIDSFHAASSALSDVDDDNLVKLDSSFCSKKSALPITENNETVDRKIVETTNPQSSAKLSNLLTTNEIKVEADSKSKCPERKDSTITNISKKKLDKSEKKIKSNKTNTVSSNKIKKAKKHRKEKKRESRCSSRASVEKKRKSRNKKRLLGSRKGLGLPSLQSQATNDPMFLNQMDKMAELLKCLHISLDGPAIDQNALPTLFRSKLYSKSVGKISKSSRLFGAQRKLILTSHNNSGKSSTESQRLLPLKKRQHRHEENVGNEKKNDTARNKTNRLNNENKSNIDGHLLPTESTTINSTNRLSVNAKINSKTPILASSSNVVSRKISKENTSTSSGVRNDKVTHAPSGGLVTEAASCTNASEKRNPEQKNLTNNHQSAVLPPKAEIIKKSKDIVESASIGTAGGVCSNASSGKEQTTKSATTTAAVNGSRVSLSSKSTSTKTVLCKHSVLNDLSTSTSLVPLSNSTIATCSATNEDKKDKYRKNSALPLPDFSPDLCSSILSRKPTRINKEQCCLSTLKQTNSIVEEEIDADDELDGSDDEKDDTDIQNKSTRYCSTPKNKCFNEPILNDNDLECKAEMAKKLLNRDNTKLSKINKKYSTVAVNGKEKFKNKSSNNKIVEQQKNNSDLNKIKKKRRRAINKTGFDKPRKRNKNIVHKAKNQSSSGEAIKKITELTKKNKPKQLPNIDKNGLKNKNKRITNGKSSSCRSESDTDSKVLQKFKNKSNRSFLPTYSDTETSFSCAYSSPELSSQEDDDDYPVYMVTKPSNKCENKNTSQKVFPIKSNPFIRPIPSKKYFQTGLYSDDFFNLHTFSETGNLEIQNLVKEDESLGGDALENENVNGDLKYNSLRPILPFPLMNLPGLSNNDSKLDELKTKVKNNTQKLCKNLQESSLMHNISYSEMNINQDFKLSFDIWYHYKYNPFPSLMRSANYRRVRQNVFVDAKPVAKYSKQSCNCVVPKNSESGCGAECINRLMNQECWPAFCPVGDKCSNQRIQRHLWSPGLQRFMTKHRGWGIRTTEKIKKGEFILEYIGEIVSERLFFKRMKERYNNDKHHYCLSIETGMVIDGYRVGNEGRFVNHSCEPNCQMQKWAVNGYYRIAMFSLRDIEPMEELFYDYNFDNFNHDSQQVCHCGSSKCRGFIGGRKTLQKLTNEINTIPEEEPSTSNANEEIEKESVEKTICKLNFADPLGNEFYLRKRLKKIKLPSNILKNNNNSSMKTDPGLMVEKKYDPLLLKRKLEPLSYSKMQRIAKNSIFMKRNFEKTRHFYLTLQNYLETSNDNENKNRSRFNEMNGNGSDSESSNSRISTNCSIKTRGLSRMNDQTQTSKLTQIYSNICNQIGMFVHNQFLEKYETNGFNKNGSNDHLKKNESIRKRKRNGCDTNNGFLNLTTIIDQVKQGKIIQIDSFEKLMIKHIKEQFLELRFPNIDICKKLKLTNGNSCPEQMKNGTTNGNDNISVNSVHFFDIETLERDTYQMLSKILNENCSIIFDIVNNKSSQSETVPEMCLKMKLNESNQEKLLKFKQKLDLGESSGLQSDFNFSFARIVESFMPKKQNIELINNNNNNKECNEEIIRCICGILREEGKMIQCDACEIWQHFDCVQQFSTVNLNDNPYICEVCNPRFVPKDIPLPKHNVPNFDLPFSLTYYLSLQSPVKNGPRVKVGDCVYICRRFNGETPEQKISDNSEIDSSKFFETIKHAAEMANKNRNLEFNREDCIIIRVQNLAIIDSTQQRILFGHHYIWPKETYHEPTRKFYPNELLRSPICEWSAIEEVRKLCMVLEPNTYVKGHPIGYDKDDVFICEMRVDRAAKSFSRIPKSAHFPINTKSYAFEKYKTKLKIKRTYSPHQVINEKNKNDEESSKRKLDESEKIKRAKMIRLLKLTNTFHEKQYYERLLTEQNKT